jgi:hypothetical protein
MRVAVVFFPINQKLKLTEIAKAFVRGVESQGHQVDIINGMVDVGKKLTIYNYINLCSEVDGIMGKIPEKVSFFLKDAGNLIGKKSSAFVLKNILGTEKALLRLMKKMEQEGMYILNSNILAKVDEAEEIGKRLNIQS